MLLALGTVAAMVLRHRFAVVAATALTLAGLSLGVCTDPMLATAWCLYPLAVALAGRVRAPLVVLAALLAGRAVVSGAPGHDRRLLLSVVALTLSWLLGTMVGRQVEAERARVRLAIARDVHDVVGHALGVIGAEAGITRSLDDATEQELRDCMAGIEQHARGALTEVQTLVRELRTADSGPDRLGALIAAVQAAGVRVEARLDPLPPLDPRLTTTVFRMVQESLSNVIRHAPAATCLVEVRKRRREILISVRDDSPARAGWAEAGGSGLPGMRERAQLIGGTLTFGSEPDAPPSSSRPASRSGRAGDQRSAGRR